MYYATLAPTKSSSQQNLNRIFDSYRDNPETPDVIGIAGTMKYFAALGVELDEPACLAVHTELEAPTMGELHRDGFTKGWRSQNSETLTAQKTTSEHLRNSMVSDPSYFRRVYRYTFVLARPEGQKAVPLEIAIEYWRMMFSGKGILWQSGGLDFLGLYLDFLSESWKKTVSKDMWDQTGVFAAKCIEDPTLSWWNENGAWPGVLDEFVAYVMAKKEEGVERMEIE